LLMIRDIGNSCVGPRRHSFLSFVVLPLLFLELEECRAESWFARFNLLY
jgi:hypothetical protein